MATSPKKVRFGMKSDGNNCVLGGSKERQLESGMGSIYAKANCGNISDVAVNISSTQDIEKSTTVKHGGSVGKLEFNNNFKPESLLSALETVQNSAINVFNSISE